MKTRRKTQRQLQNVAELLHATTMTARAAVHVAAMGAAAAAAAAPAATAVAATVIVAATTATRATIAIVTATPPAVAQVVRA